MNTRKKKLAVRERRARRNRAKVLGSAERPRLAVHRSNRFISVQLINDLIGRTMAHASSRGFTGTKSARAREVGIRIAALARDRGITRAVFDRRRYKYHGQVKNVAEGARSAGLKF